jgi:hypothetical protein
MMTPDNWTLFPNVSFVTDQKQRALVLQEMDLTEAKLLTIANNYKEEYPSRPLVPVEQNKTRGPKGLGAQGYMHILGGLRAQGDKRFPG